MQPVCFDPNNDFLTHLHDGQSTMKPAYAFVRNGLMPPKVPQAYFWLPSGKWGVPKIGDLA